jgi:signal transduction histidine kinase/HPt (histidine-containing phosphotransfer) domain-containing protein/ActR/RegA family two-component response regulator
MFRISRVCLALTVLGTALAGGYIMRQMFDLQERLREGARYNVTWSVSQGLSEYARLQLAISRARRDGSNDEVMLRYNICLNRLRVLSAGDVATFIATNPANVATVGRIAAALAVLGPLLEHIDEPGVAEQANAMLTPVTQALAALGSAANRYGGERLARDQTRLFALHWIFSGLMATLICAGVGLMIVLAWRTTELHVAQGTLEDTTGRLSDADAVSKARATILATLSHEIRTPLNAIMGLTTSLLDDVKSGPHRELLETISDASNGLLRLLNDILDFSKLDAGQMTLEDITFATAAPARNAMSIMSARAAAKFLRRRMVNGPDLPPGVVGDAGRIEQVLLNLVSNAVKFTEHGDITIETSHVSNEPGQASIIWRVSDTGIGIPADRLDKLFTEFMQADSSITRRFGGTGLGLTISKRLIDQMGGTITVASTAGAGTTFTVTLAMPTADAPDAGATEADDSVARFKARIQAYGRKPRILFVDDNTTNQYVVTQLLRGFDVQLDMAANGLEALDSVSRFAHDLICMDVRMPVMDGLEATRRIRQMGGRLAHVPIIALTANAFSDDIETCLAAGMNCFVSKPVRRDQLLNAFLSQLPDPEIGQSGKPPLPVSRPTAAAIGPPEQPAFDNLEFSDLIETIGEAGVNEMVRIFETETRHRLRRLTAHDQDDDALVFEMHTLKGAADTVAAPRLAALGRTLEHAAIKGIRPPPADIEAIADALDAWLEAVNARNPEISSSVLSRVHSIAAAKDVRSLVLMTEPDPANSVPRERVQSL